MSRKTVSLTSAQQRVVDFRGSMMLVYGPPGSGKTEVLAQRTRSLIADPSTGTSKILALTFSRQAAQEMRQRLVDVPDAEQRVEIHTTHAWSLSILRSHGHLLGIPSEPTIYASREDQRAALHLALTESDWGDAGALDADGIEGLLSALEDPRGQGAKSTWNGVPLQELRRIYESYVIGHGALDFSLMLRQATRLFRDHPKAARLYRSVYRFVHVDEAQDLTMQQWELLRAFWGNEPGCVILLADPAQSIYGFRGAQPEELEDVAQAFEAARLDLTASHRCAREVLRASSPLLGRGDLVDSNEASGRPEGFVGYFEFADSHSEAAAVVEWVRRLTSKGLKTAVTGAAEREPLPPEQIAILGRNRSHLQAVLQRLDSEAVEHQLVLGDRSLCDTETFDAVVRSIGLLAHPDDLALRASLLGAFGLRGTRGQIDYREALELVAVSSVDEDPLLASILRILLRDEDEIDAALEAIERMTVDHASVEQADLMIADRDFVLGRARRHLNRTDPSDWTWSGVLRELTDVPRAEDPGVRVSTIHGSKGREYAAVVVVGMNEGMFPDFRDASTERGLASERRLAYVAMTRAQYALLLTRPAVIETRNGPWERPPSQFLGAMGLSPSNAF